jgi:hypothetical protein
VASSTISSCSNLKICKSFVALETKVYNYILLDLANKSGLLNLWPITVVSNVQKKLVGAIFSFTKVATMMPLNHICGDSRYFVGLV